MGWGKEGPAHRSISRQMDILEQGCQVLSMTQTSFPSPSTPPSLILYIKELKVSEVANITFSRSWFLRACALSTLPQVFGREICRQKSVVCDLGQVTPLSDSAGVSISKGRRSGLMRTALLQGLTPGTQECAQAPRDRASWSRAWAPRASVRGVTPLVPGLRPIHSVVL